MLPVPAAVGAKIGMAAAPQTRDVTAAKSSSPLDLNPMHGVLSKYTNVMKGFQNRYGMEKL